MSRIGKMPVSVPSGVKVSLVDKEITIKGKLGELKTAISPNVTVLCTESEIKVIPANDSNTSRAMWGLMRSLISNMVQGVTEGYTENLEISGVGYKTALKGRMLILSLGFSHDIFYAIPEGIDIKCEKPTLIAITGVNKQLIGQVAAELMMMRPFEPYKGKGVFKKGKPGRRKEGKKK